MVVCCHIVNSYTVILGGFKIYDMALLYVYKLLPKQFVHFCTPKVSREAGLLITNFMDVLILCGIIKNYCYIHVPLQIIFKILCNYILINR